MTISLAEPIKGLCTRSSSNNNTRTHALAEAAEALVAGAIHYPSLAMTEGRLQMQINLRWE